MIRATLCRLTLIRYIGPTGLGPKGGEHLIGSENAGFDKFQGGGFVAGFGQGKGPPSAGT